MQTEILSKQQLSDNLISTAKEYSLLVENLDEEQFNKVPFEGSWTPAQLFQHVTKSIKDVPKVLEDQTEAISRDATAKVEELKRTFLDFSTKMKSPAFIEPDNETQAKEKTITEFQEAFTHVVTAIAPAGLNQTIKKTPFGEISKLEMLHFILFHTQRHLHQLKKITAAL